VAPFSYTIAICKGCMTLCESKLLELKMLREDVVGEKCDNNTSSDGRVCFDPDC